jgi:hypothetical protein
MSYEGYKKFILRNQALNALTTTTTQPQTRPNKKNSSFAIPMKTRTETHGS